MKGITLSKAVVQKQGGVVILPIKEYQRLLAASVPTYRLRGGAAKRLDMLVERSMREYREGKTHRLYSLSDLDG